MDIPVNYGVKGFTVAVIICIYDCKQVQTDLVGFWSYGPNSSSNCSVLTTAFMEKR